MAEPEKKEEEKVEEPKEKKVKYMVYVDAHKETEDGLDDEEIAHWAVICTSEEQAKQMTGSLVKHLEKVWNLSWPK